MCKPNVNQVLLYGYVCIHPSIHSSMCIQGLNAEEPQERQEPQLSLTIGTQGHCLRNRAPDAPLVQRMLKPRSAYGKAPVAGSVRPVTHIGLVAQCLFFISLCTVAAGVCTNYQHAVLIPNVWLALTLQQSGPA